jgi:hypothetical protein
MSLGRCPHCGAEVNALVLLTASYHFSHRTGHLVYWTSGPLETAAVRCGACHKWRDDLEVRDGRVVRKEKHEDHN